MAEAGDDVMDRPPHEPSLRRTPVTYESDPDRFALPKRDFTQQYASLYAARLKQMRPSVTQRAKTMWPSLPFRHKILELKEGEECVVVGTLYKEMPLKPSILDEYAKDRAIVGQVLARHSLVSIDDALVLEDETGRLRLTLSTAKIHCLSTGLIAAIRGREQRDGDFEVAEFCFATPSPPSPLSPSATSRSPVGGGKKYAAFLCGLHLGGGRAASTLLPLKLCVDLLAGLLGSSAEQFAARDIVHLVIAGDSFSEVHGLSNVDVTARVSSRLGSLSNLEEKNATGNVASSAVLRELDLLLTQLARTVRVDLMPGSHDPSNFALPQQPLHRCLFPNASFWTSLHLASNPHAYSLDGVNFLGSSGQPLADLSRFTLSTGENSSPDAEPDRLDLLQRTLEWGHMAPTAPDTLGCYPFYESDPFIITQAPHVYFAANQPRFSSRLFNIPSVKKGPPSSPVSSPVRLLLLPPFSTSPSLFLVDLASLDVHQIDFATY